MERSAVVDNDCDEFYYVADFVKGGLPLGLMVVGLVATLAGFVPPRRKEETTNE